ncbi:hypothetical protein SEPCBS119000_002277 [Sporothrix epigloea]|uniref:Pre-mRNA-splicing factor 38 n=1 Tax=Sporothrix epigloea TaxID=1892477 RepID=A0ABP0DIM8_9PEZI
MSGFHQADERRFLDERGSSVSVAPNGLNPATIMEKAVRERIVDSYFWKEQCFGVNEADIVDRVVDHVSCIGGTTGTTQKPTPFLCLALKLLQLAPNDTILQAYLQQGGDKFKYLRALALFYVRLTRPAIDVYTTLEPFLADRRKLRHKTRAGTRLTFVDAFVDDLLVQTRVCATSLWKLPQREDLEDLGKLEPRESALGDIDELLEDDEAEEVDTKEDGGVDQEKRDDSEEENGMQPSKRRRDSSESSRNGSGSNGNEPRRQTTESGSESDRPRDRTR